MPSFKIRMEEIVAEIIKALTNDNPRRKHGKPVGAMTEFRLGRSIRGVTLDPNARHFVRLQINGQEEEFAELGGKSMLPREYLELLKDAKSTAVVTDLRKVDPDQGGVARGQRDFRQPQTRIEYLGDYELWEKED